MTAHTHPDPARLVVACPACADRARSDQDAARWAEAPVRAVTWHCTFCAVGQPGRLSFTRNVKVPAGATGWDVDERHPDLVGNAFVTSLPDTVPIHATAEACDTMDVERVDIRQIVETEPRPTDDQPSLFGGAT